MRTEILNRTRVIGAAAALALTIVPSILARPHSASAASSIQSLVAQAQHNNDTVNTLMHRDTETIAAKGVTVSVSSHGAEDEVHNREQDFESVTLHGLGPNGKAVTQHYTVDIIFLNGMTYYRSSLSQNKWKSYKGITFQDPFTGGWRRARTTVIDANYKVSPFTEVGTSGGQTHVRGTFTDAKHKQAGTIDLWISGSKPYVVQEVQNIHSTQGTKITEKIQSLFGPFNTRLIILPPTNQGST
jgi:hypothetical protein